MIKGQPYQAPPPTFQPGDRVRYEGHTYTVLASSHTHSQLEGLRWAVANWQLQRVKSRRQSPTPKK
ncbi:MAG TPA: hypothetical protein V6D11_12350 [Waterburya sp.]|jgi:hypothetical protein